MKRCYRLIGLALIAFGLGTPTYAGPITLSGGTAGTIPGDPAFATNDFIPTLFGGPEIGGFFGAEILFDILGPSVLLIEFFGADARYVNSFVYEQSTVFTHAGDVTITNIAPSLADPLGTFLTALSGSGTLPFAFRVNGTTASVVNGSNPDNTGAEPNFFATCDPFSQSAGAGGTSCSSAYLFLDDGAVGPDEDHDDFLVRVSVVPVPEPATIVTSLLGLGFLAARRSKSRR